MLINYKKWSLKLRNIKKLKFKRNNLPCESRRLKTERFQSRKRKRIIRLRYLGFNNWGSWNRMKRVKWLTSKERRDISLNPKCEVVVERRKERADTIVNVKEEDMMIILLTDIAKKERNQKSIIKKVKNTINDKVNCIFKRKIINNLK